MAEAIKRALLSVTDKSGLVEFARALSQRGVEIIASGGTAAALRSAEIEVTEIQSLTSFPECMDGRVKTLHPKVHGGILADRAKRAHLQQARDLDIELIDLVVVNLYRFSEVARDPSRGESETIEQIDIGGPALIRSAAKNFASVTVVVDPGEYRGIIEEMDANAGAVTADTRRRLAAAAFDQTAAYDAAISGWFSSRLGKDEFPASIATHYRRIRSLRYGENPHQRAALYVKDQPTGLFHEFVQHQGKELSFNNIQDMWAAFLLAADLGPAACAIIKHMNPCGAAACAAPGESFVRARETDPTSAFGGVVAVNAEVDEEFAAAVVEGFVEVVCARGFGDGALALFAKKKNLRLISVPGIEWERPRGGFDAREAGDLLIVQDRDEGFPELDRLEIATSRHPTPEEERALVLAWKIAKHVKSNAIVICDRLGTLGIGAGQMSRVDSCRIAVEKARIAQLSVEGGAAGSDAFFPFPDGVELLARAGVTSVVQPGGSLRDAEVVEAAEKLGITMAIAGRRHFRH